MINKILLLVLTAVTSATFIHAQPASDPRRLEVLFVGDDGEHQPLERYRALKLVLGTQGINLSYLEDLDRLNRATLDRHDALMVYANRQEALPADVIPWIRDGGGLVAVHSASKSFPDSPEWTALIGAALENFEVHSFTPETVDTEHVVTLELRESEIEDQTYRHVDFADDVHVLQVRPPLNAGETEPVPWSWVREEENGRVFYTAGGHGTEVWEEGTFQTLLYRAILWAVGDERAEAFRSFELPEIVHVEPELEDRAFPDIPMLPLQTPFSPEESAAHTQVPAGTRLELFASEPMVVNPIAIDWDEHGRAWVVEALGYPNDVPEEPGTGMDRIKILEDTTGDGRADKMTVFAEGLRHATTTVFVNGGVLATDGRDIVFLRDETGDGKADTREVLATGLRIWDTHASTSHFHYGLDNWIYAVVGYSGIDMELHGEHHEFGQSVFRFRPDLSKLELLQNTTNNTWGIGLTEEGDVMGSTANNNPSWIVSIPASAYAGTGIEQPRTPRADTSTLVYPNTRDFTQVDFINRYTSAAGHAFYNDNIFGDLLGPDSVLVTDPTVHLVGIGQLEDRDALKAVHFRGNNLLASADAWVAPVAVRAGPDGAVWIADWYNPIAQHNVVFRFWNPRFEYDHPHSPYHTGHRGPGAGNAYVTPLRDREHGRIWRVVPADGEIRREVALDAGNPEALLAALSSPSQHIRLHAQRLLVERGEADVVPALVDLVSSEATSDGGQKPLAAVHAIWTLEGLNQLERTGSDARNTVTNLLSVSANPLLRRHALLALGAEDPAVVRALPSLIMLVEEPRERLFALTLAAQSVPNEPVARIVWALVAGEDALERGALRQAARLAMRRQGSMTLIAAARTLDERVLDTWYAEELMAIAERVAAGPQRPVLVDLVDQLPAAFRPPVEEMLAATAVAEVALPELPEHLVAAREYYRMSCLECHQPDGTGVPGSFPALVGAGRVHGDPDTLLRVILGGMRGPVEIAGERFDSIMPGASHLENDQIAAIASYVRYAFAGLSEDPVSPDAVEALRGELEERRWVPYTPEELDELEGN